MNISNKDPSIHFESVTKEVAQMFCQSYAPEMNIEMVDIDPSKDEQFPGIVDLRKELEVCYRVSKVNSLSWATNKWFEGQISFFKVREFKFELGKICQRHLYLEDMFFFLGQKLVQTDKIPPNTSVYIRNTFFFWKNVFSSIFEGSLGKVKFHVNVKWFILSWPSQWWGMVTVFFLQAKGINIIRTDACALQVLLSQFFYNQLFFSTVGLLKCLWRTRMNLYSYLDWEFNLGPNSGMQTVVPLCLPCCTENSFCLKSFCLARNRAVNL